jgi:aminoglycoside phosphotransferase (APT) family kinase protein
MPTTPMHADEVATSVPLVRRLVVEQFPHWADLPIAPVPSAGTDNALYRLGDAMVVRLPRIEGATSQVEKEQRWLPRIAPHLPLAIPEPLAMGEPGAGYPWRWSVYRWLGGESVTAAPFADPVAAARDLAAVIAAQQRIDVTDGPRPGPHNSSRGVPLALRDASTRESIAALRGTIDTNAALAGWEAALVAQPWQGAPVWIHGDLQSGNLLSLGGRLSGVIDFGCLAGGDPACDLMVAWNLFSGESRRAFRAALAVDDATWARGRGWALSVGVIALPYYRTTNPVLAGISRRAIDAVLADCRARD